MKKAQDLDQETVRLISKELIDIYKKLAEKYEVEAKDFDENIQAALGYYEQDDTNFGKHHPFVVVWFYFLLIIKNCKKCKTSTLHREKKK